MSQSVILKCEKLEVLRDWTTTYLPHSMDAGIEEGIM